VAALHNEVKQRENRTMDYYTINKKQAAAKGIIVSTNVIFYDGYSIEIVNSNRKWFTVKPYWSRAFERDLERYGVTEYITTEEV